MIPRSPQTYGPLFEVKPESKPTKFAGVTDALWDAKNPGVYAEFKRIAFERKAQRDHYSARSILHEMRDWTNASMDGKWKMDNRASTYMARRLVKDHPEFDGWFEFRERRGESGEAAA